MTPVHCKCNTLCMPCAQLRVTSSEPDLIVIPNRMDPIGMPCMNSGLHAMAESLCVYACVRVRVRVRVCESDYTSPMIAECGLIPENHGALSTSFRSLPEF